jgi:hypothetical protein
MPELTIGNHKFNLTWAAVPLVVAALIVWLIANGSSSSAPVASSSPRTPVVRHIAAPSQSAWAALTGDASKVDPRFRVSKPAFEHRIPIAVSPQTPMPLTLERHLDEVLKAPSHAFTYSVRVKTPLGPLWIEATDTLVCLVRGGTAATSCMPPTSGSGGLMHQGLLVGTSAVVDGHREYRLSGLVSDKVRAVELKAGNRHYRVPITASVFDSEARDRVEVVRFILP